MIIINAVEGKKICLGRIGENEARAVRFDIGKIQAEFPGAEYSLLNMRPSDPDSYPINSQYIRIENGGLLWVLQSGDLAEDGLGECELKATLGSQILKDTIWTTEVLRALDGNGTPPEPWESWQQQVEDDANRAEAAAELLEHPGAEAETLPAGSQATASYADGVFTFGIPMGKDGLDGDTPTARVSKVGNTATITITDKDGTTTAQISDGTDGEDGFSPSASVTKSGKTATISITDKEETTTAQISDGEDGEPGAVPIISIGTVTTLPAGSSATASMDTTDPEHPVLSLGLVTGDPGEVTEAELEAVETELKSAIDGKADLIRDTVSNVAIASVPDAAANLPLTALKIAVDPIQDLHGQDSPYPPGGGKNLIPPINTQPESGEVIIEYPTEKTLNGFSISMKFSGSFVNAGASFIDLQDEDGNHGYITPTAFGLAAGTTYTKQAVSYSSTEIKKIKKIVYFRYPNFTNPVFDDLMLEQGSTPTTFAPYSNICPISGWTGCNVARTGKNLCSLTFSQINENNILTNAFSLKKGTYTFSVNYNGVPTWGTYLRNGDLISSPVIAYIYNNTVFTFTLDRDYENLCFSMYYGNGISVSEVTELMLELGSTAHAYTPFIGTTYPISWQTEAGTVYGGWIDLVTGVLTGDKVFANLNDKTLWYDDSGFIVYRYDFSDRKLFTDSFTGLISSFALADETKPVYIRWRGALQTRIRVYGVPIETLQSMSDAGTATICYELATPITYQLTPTEISTIKGQMMNVWADCGDVLEMTYPCDTKAYIDKKLAELTALVLES